MESGRLLLLLALLSFSSVGVAAVGALSGVRRLSPAICPLRVDASADASAPPSFEQVMCVWGGCLRFSSCRPRRSVVRCCGLFYFLRNLLCPLAFVVLLVCPSLAARTRSAMGQAAFSRRDFSASRACYMDAMRAYWRGFDMAASQQIAAATAGDMRHLSRDASALTANLGSVYAAARDAGTLVAPAAGGGDGGGDRGGLGNERRTGG